MSDEDTVFTNDGQGGFTSLDSSGTVKATGLDPVDNLIMLAGALADQDGEE